MNCQNLLNNLTLKKEFIANLDVLIEDFHDEQYRCTTPAYPLMKGIKQIFIDTYHGKI